jgi:sulfur-carrier protein adenylyltransferase/sulfurtransferase
VRPLVEPAPPLSAAEIGRYSRHLLLPELGDDGQRRLKNASVLVIGAGGLGSPVLMYLAAAGVGTIGILDHDVVEESNLQRQVVHSSDDVGRAKVDSAADAVTAINPHVRVVRHRVRLDRTNALDLLADYHLVLDGTDNFATRYLVDDACAVLGRPLVWGSIFRFDGQVSVFWSAPPEERHDQGTAGSPRGAGPEPVTYRDLHPTPPPAGSVPSCAEGGVLGVVCAAIGSVMATEAVKLICGIGEPLLGRLMIFDALAMTWRTVRIRRHPATEPVKELLPDYEAFCGVASAPARDALDDVGAGRGVISVTELATRLERRAAGDEDFVLVDVREPAERLIATIPGAVPVPLGQLRGGAAGEVLGRVAAGRAIVLHCKSGGRSAEALELAREAGFRDAVHVAGGVLAWIDEIDPGQSRY